MENKTNYTKVREGAHTQIFEPVRQCVYINAEDKLILSYVLGWQNDKGKDRQECSESNPKLIKHLGFSESVLERRIQVLNTTTFFNSKRVQREYADGMMAWGKVMIVNEAALLEFINSPFDYNKRFNKDLNDRKKVNKVQPKALKAANPVPTIPTPAPAETPVKVAQMTFEAHAPETQPEDYSGNWDKKRFFKRLDVWEKVIRSTEDAKDMAPWAITQELSRLYYTHIHQHIPEAQRPEMLELVYNYEETVIKRRIKITA